MVVDDNMVKALHAKIEVATVYSARTKMSLELSKYLD